MKTYILFLMLSFFSLLSSAQNLVPNPGFETNFAYPTNRPDLNCLASWKDYSGTANPGMKTPDLCFIPNPGIFPMQSMPAYEGSQYMALDCSNPNSEYIQIKMNAPMVEGASYCVSYYVSAYNKFNTLTPVGAYFSTTSLTVNPHVLGLVSQIQSAVVPNMTTWQRVNAIYVANGGEQYMTMGGFEHGGPLFSYMYVDMVEVYRINPVLELGNDKIVCRGEEVILNAGTDGSAYVWSNGKTTSAITITTPGKYWVEKFYGACSVSDTIKITSVPDDLGLGEERKLCMGEQTRLDAGANGTSYTWSNGEHTSFINVTLPGKYWVEKIQGTCSVSDTIIITLSDCLPSPPIPVVEGTLFVPNAFTPNNDGLNDRFEVKAYNIHEYKMMIYNRWGEAVFTTEDLADQWNGIYKKQEAEEGVYSYLLSYKNGSKAVNTTGHIMLVR